MEKDTTTHPSSQTVEESMATKAAEVHIFKSANDIIEMLILIFNQNL